MNITHSHRPTRRSRLPLLLVAWITWPVWLYALVAVVRWLAQ